VRVRHVLFAVTPGIDVAALRHRAEACLLDVRCHDGKTHGGASAGFERAARELSNCPSGAEGGELGWLTPADCAPEFAREIFRLSGQSPDLTGVTAVEYGARARRPAYSVLAHRRLAGLGEDDLRPWQEALADYLRERAGVSAAPAPAGS